VVNILKVTKKVGEMTAEDRGIEIAQGYIILHGHIVAVFQALLCGPKRRILSVLILKTTAGIRIQCI